MKVLLCHPQTQHSYKLARVLYDLNYLYKFETSLALSTEITDKLPRKVVKHLKNRVIDVPNEYVNKNILLEVKRALNKYVFRQYNQLNYFYYNQLFQEGIASSIIKASNLIIGFDSSSHVLLDRALKYNKKYILERTIGHHAYYKKLYLDSVKRYPEWESYLKPTMTEELIAIENKELYSTDIITVGSEFVKKTLLENNIPDKKIIVNPYGVNTDYFISKKQKKNETLNFLFFGSLSARKGIHVLLKAWSILSPRDATLTIAGYGSLPSFVRLPNNVILLGTIKPDERNALYNNADVFVFPSLFEGFAQVLIEAACCGLPLITTSNAGGDEIVTDGVNGFLVPHNDYIALAEKINYYIMNPDKAFIMGNELVDTIKSRFSLTAYKNRWDTIIKNS